MTASIVAEMAVAQVTTVCSLYGNTAYCTSNDQGARLAEQQREQYETGAAIGNASGMAVFRAHFPGWRRKYCSKHPNQPFVYANAAGDSITGTCPSIDGLANEVAAQWVSKHRDYQQSPENGKTMSSYLAGHRLSLFESKSYDEAYRNLKASGPQPLEQSAPLGSIPPELKSVLNFSPAVPVLVPSLETLPNNIQPSPPHDVFVWFDEPAPTPGAPLFEAVVTSRAYDGALAILRQARHGNTSVQAGTSVLNTDYHPSTMSLAAWQAGHPQSAPALFYWQGEQVNDATLVMHFQMTRRAYEQMFAITAGSELRSRPLVGEWRK
jgi:hypothetical protein